MAAVLSRTLASVSSAEDLTAAITATAAVLTLCRILLAFVLEPLHV